MDIIISVNILLNYTIFVISIVIYSVLSSKHWKIIGPLF